MLLLLSLLAADACSATSYHPLPIPSRRPPYRRFVHSLSLLFALPRQLPHPSILSNAHLLSELSQLMLFCKRAGPLPHLQRHRAPATRSQRHRIWAGSGATPMKPGTCCPSFSLPPPPPTPFSIFSLVCHAYAGVHSGFASLMLTSRRLQAGRGTVILTTAVNFKVHRSAGSISARSRDVSAHYLPQPTHSLLTYPRSHQVKHSNCAPHNGGASGGRRRTRDNR